MAGPALLEAQPVNDNFANPQSLAGSRGVVTVFTVGATREASEPYIAGKNNGGASVWFRWIAPVSGSFKFDTEASEFDTLLAIYKNSSLGALAPVASSDNIARDNLQSQATFSATAGQTYQVTVDGKQAAAGYLVLTWGPATPSPAAPATNDAFANACVLSGPLGRASASSVNATKEAGEPYHAGVPDGKTVWFLWKAPGSGCVSFDTARSDFDTLMAAYQGSGLASLTRLAANNDIGNFTRQSRILFRVTAGQDYLIAVGGVQTFSGATRDGAVELAWRFDAGAGGNDFFANAQALSGPHGVAFGVNSDASREPDEPVRADNPGGKSIWYRWTAPVSGPAIFDSAGTQFDAPFFNYALLTVYAGSALDSLTSLADNCLPATGGYSESVSFTALAGTLYYVSVDGYYDGMLCHCHASGAVQLGWTQPEAILLSGPRQVDAETIEFDLTAPTGRNGTLQTSTNLVDWEQSAGFTTEDYRTLLRIPRPPNGPALRAFRATLQP